MKSQVQSHLDTIATTKFCLNWMDSCYPTGPIAAGCSRVIAQKMLKSKSSPRPARNTKKIDPITVENDKNEIG